jgi:hypothetical protein
MPELWPHRLCLHLYITIHKKSENLQHSKQTIQNKTRAIYFTLYKTELILKKKGYWTKKQHCGQRKCICISNAIKSARS